MGLLRRSERKDDGLRQAPKPPTGADALEVARHYVAWYVEDFSRTRRVAKRRARNTVVSMAVLTAAIAVVGASFAVVGWKWLGILSAALAGASGVISAWDGLLKHRELWIIRSLVLSRLMELQRQLTLREALGEDRGALASESMDQLDDILREDLSSWSDVRKRQLSQGARTDTSQQRQPLP